MGNGNQKEVRADRGIASHLKMETKGEREGTIQAKGRWNPDWDVGHRKVGTKKECEPHSAGNQREVRQ